MCGVIAYLCIKYGAVEIFGILVAMKPDDITGWLEYIKLAYRRRQFGKCVGACLGAVEWGVSFEEYPILAYYLWKSYDAMYYHEIGEIYYNKLIQIDVSFEEKEDEWNR